MFERFSSRFGPAEPNPGLDPERATSFEIGGSTRLGRTRLFGSVFYSKLDDALVTIRTAQDLNRRENIGSADYYGAELGVDAQFSPTLQAGLNYSYIHRSFDIGSAPLGGFVREFRLTDVPSHKGFVWMSWELMNGLTVLPSIEFASGRTTMEAATASGDTPVCYDLKGYVTATLRLEYSVNEHVTLGIGARNLFDEYYTLTDGFPEPGRSVFMTARGRF